MIASGGDQEDVPESLAETLVPARWRCGGVVKTEMASKPRDGSALGMSLAGARLLARWCPALRRREPGLRLLHGT